MKLSRFVPMIPFLVFYVTTFVFACGSDKTPGGEPWELKDDFECLADECPELACLSVRVETIPREHRFTRRNEGEGPGFLIENHCSYDLFFERDFLDINSWLAEFREIGSERVVPIDTMSMLTVVYPIPEGQEYWYLRLRAGDTFEVSLPSPTATTNFMRCYEDEAVGWVYRDDGPHLESVLLLPNPRKLKPEQPESGEVCRECSDLCDPLAYESFVEEQSLIRSFETIRL